MPGETQPFYVGQVIFLRMVEESDNRAVLAKVALALARADVDADELRFREVLELPSWQEFHAILAFAGLGANVVVRWSDDELASLRAWAKG